MSRWVSVLLALVAISAASRIEAGTGQSVYLTLRAGAQKIDGGVYRHGHEGAILCTFYEQTMTAAREGNVPNGLPTGKRDYAPVLCRKTQDAASPLLAKALVENQSLEAEFHFVYATPSGAEFTSYTVSLKDARVAFFRQYIAEPPVGSPPSHVAGPLLEDVGFVFRQIEWRVVDPNIAYADVTARSEAATTKDVRNSRAARWGY